MLLQVVLLVVKCDDLLPVGASGRQPPPRQQPRGPDVRAPRRVHLSCAISHDWQPVTHHRHAGATRHAPRCCIPPRPGAGSLAGTRPRVRRCTELGPDVLWRWARPGSASRQLARPFQRRATPVPTPINRTASAATRAGLPPTAVTARTAPSRRSLLHRLQTCRGAGMGADQIVRRPQRLGSQPRRQQCTSGYRTGS